jgi:hypothetical protein
MKKFSELKVGDTLYAWEPTTTRICECEVSDVETHGELAGVRFPSIPDVSCCAEGVDLIADRNQSLSAKRVKDISRGEDILYYLSADREILLKFAKEKIREHLQDVLTQSQWIESEIARLH